MKTVLPSIPPEVLAWRKKTGADRWDEMWDGVYHMGPSPNYFHQDFIGALENYLRLHWAPRCGGKVLHEWNVAPPSEDWRQNYRIPDLVLFTPERASGNKIEYFEGGPDVVLEMQSPGDESEAKLPFYFKLGVAEVWLIHRDTKAVRVLVHGPQSFVAAPRAADGWIASAATGVAMRRREENKLEICIAGDETTRTLIPA